MGALSVYGWPFFASLRWMDRCIEEDMRRCERVVWEQRMADARAMTREQEERRAALRQSIRTLHAESQRWKKRRRELLRIRRSMSKDEWLEAAMMDRIRAK